ncbi:STAS domain-containing protein [Pseudoflavonifractor phocaeensis]|uniref:STAS domain-containing protein n=1 Tax=Pseudoflavonifractor phocaeensis TaxID=1870988 RepID=UPI003091E1E8|nr:anti-sigma factor antagonist [Oscillospiraceae bacterium]
MPVTCAEEGRALTVRVEGEVDHHAARQLMEELGRRVDTALPRSLTLDLGGVSFMDSSGIAVVLRTWRRMSQLGGVMTVRNVPPQAAKVLKAAGIDKLIPFQE